VKTRALSFAFAVASVALGGCHLYNNDNDNTACSGYLGCSRSQGQIGIQPPVDPCTGKVYIPRTTNVGCGKDLPAMQIPTVKDKPTGYTHYMVQGTGDTLAAMQPTKVGPRTFWVRVPQDYDPSHKYRTVYIGQGCGGYNVANTSTVQFFKETTGGDEEAIYVALDIPTDMANQDCYDNRDGPASQEWEAFQLFHDLIDDTYCVDNNRVYISGYSTGGWLTNMWGCYFAGDGYHPWNGVPGTIAPMSIETPAGTELTSRAGQVGDGGTATDSGSAGGSGGAGAGGAGGADQGSAGQSGSAGSGGAGAAGAGAAGAGGAGGMSAPATGGCVPRKFAREYHIRAQSGISGGEPDNNPPCNGPIAAIWIHDLGDSNAYTANHDIALPRVLKMNGCFSKTPKTKPWHEDIMGVGVCVQYTDCPAAYPVVFCTTTGQGHADQHERAIPGYNAFWKEMEAAAGLKPASGF
jgi:poly(3-hydroxybutyrate) depolymerase